MTDPMPSRPRPAAARTARPRLLAALAGVALALALLGAAVPAGPAAAIGRICPPGAPNCDPE
jgi:hypothetical protein